MRKAQKQEVLDCISSLHQAHEEIKAAFKKNNVVWAKNMLVECQNFAVSLGENIEKLEGEGHTIISHLESYCEVLFHVYEEAEDTGINVDKVCKALKKQLLRVENSVKNEIRIRKEIVFLPYKSTMWDSMESVYLAAKADPDCDVYCVPIPYYDRNPDGSLGELHYEGMEYPAYIEVTNWRNYQIEKRKPDAIYIHNPYDDCNLVTSVHPKYYSFNLRKFTELLVYIPYYSTTGGMSAGQRLCRAYLNVDYIVIQSPELRLYFDKEIPDRKFLPFGSPKIDRIIRICQNPPEPPEEWKAKMKGRKVYFYNTSISGLLGNTEFFLKKMQYVFSCFEGRKDACLLWRPHPLLETTFEAMRPEYKPLYEKIKKSFVDKDLGILDITPDMANAIALSDVYIGDSGSSVVSLFGVVGKPIFILNNRLHSAPKKDSWQGQISPIFNYKAQHKYIITQGNKLYVSEPFQYDYHFACDLLEYTLGGFYSTVQEIGDKIYVCPSNAENILVIGKNGIERKIELEKRVANDGRGAFVGSGLYENYLWLQPAEYPAVVFYNTMNGEITYFKEFVDTFTKKDDGGRILSGAALLREKEGCLYIASPTDNYVYKLNIKKKVSQVIELPVKSQCGCQNMREFQGEFWLTPFEGRTIVRWNPDTGAVREYMAFPEGFTCIDPVHRIPCEKRPFAGYARYGDELYLAPCWGNMFVKLNVETGEVRQWHLPVDFETDGEYYYAPCKATLLWNGEEISEGNIKLYLNGARKLYELNLQTGECKEIEIKFDVNELKRNEPGFCEESEQLRYCCRENALNSLIDLLDDNISGNQFDRERQLAAYRRTVSDCEGNCGRKVHEFISKQIAQNI